MRDIKFRVWIRIQYDFEKTNNPYQMIYPHLDKDTWWVIDCKTQTLMEGEGGVMSSFPMYVMQYTGLKDKNGKEIYEGDILSDNTLPRVVAWGSRSNTTYGHGDSTTELNIGFKFSSWGSRVGSIEVIGNIYENPELIEK